VDGNGDAATAAPGSGIVVLSDPFRTAPVIIDNPQLLDMQPMWANCPTSDNNRGQSDCSSIAAGSTYVTQLLEELSY